MHSMRVLVVTFAEVVHVKSQHSVPSCLSLSETTPRGRMLLSFSLRCSAAESGRWDGDVLQVKDQLEDAMPKAEEWPYNTT